VEIELRNENEREKGLKDELFKNVKEREGDR